MTFAALHAEPSAHVSPLHTIMPLSHAQLRVCTRARSYGRYNGIVVAATRAPRTPPPGTPHLEANTHSVVASKQPWYPPRQSSRGNTRILILEDSLPTNPACVVRGSVCEVRRLTVSFGTGMRKQCRSNSGIDGYAGQYLATRTHLHPDGATKACTDSKPTCILNPRNLLTSGTKLQY